MTREMSTLKAPLLKKESNSILSDFFLMMEGGFMEGFDLSEKHGILNLLSLLCCFLFCFFSPLLTNL